jgi:hypothetical protein
MTGQIYLNRLVFPSINRLKIIILQWNVFSSPGQLAGANFIYRAFQFCSGQKTAITGLRNPLYRMSLMLVLLFIFPLSYYKTPP